MGNVLAAPDSKKSSTAGMDASTAGPIHRALMGLIRMAGGSTGNTSSPAEEGASSKPRSSPGGSGGGEGRGRA